MTEKIPKRETLGPFDWDLIDVPWTMDEKQWNNGKMMKNYGNDEKRWKVMKNDEIQWKTMETMEKRWKTMKNDEIQWKMMGNRTMKKDKKWLKYVKYNDGGQISDASQQVMHFFIIFPWADYITEITYINCKVCIENNVTRFEGHERLQ